MSIFTVICAGICLFLLMRGVAATMEYKRYRKNKPLYIMEEHRRSVLVGRCLAFLMMLSVIGFFIYEIVTANSILDVDLIRPFALILGLAFFAFVPFSSCRWVMQEDGLYIYNSNRFLPWTQLITTGVQRKKGKTFLVLQIKKEAGEIFKQTYYMLMVKDEDADRLSEMIKQFIRSLDKMKRIKHIQDEKKVPKKKRTWY